MIPVKKGGDSRGGDSAKTSTASETATSTKTATSTDAYTQGNITVTGGAGAGATSVTINIPRGNGGDPARKAKEVKETNEKKKSVAKKMGKFSK